MSCEKEALKKGKNCIQGRVAGLLHLNVVVTYQVLGYEPTRLSSLVSETNWARKCRSHGYDIANKRRCRTLRGLPSRARKFPRAGSGSSAWMRQSPTTSCSRYIAAPVAMFSMSRFHPSAC